MARLEPSGKQTEDMGVTPAWHRWNSDQASNGRLFANVWQQCKEARALDRIFNGALKRCAVTATLAAEHLSLASAHLAQGADILIVHECGAGAPFFRAETATIFADLTLLLLNHRCAMLPS
jgi:hypothetical protein